MKIVAYLYSDPLLESPPSVDIWGLEVDAVYQDLGKRHQLQQLLQDCSQYPPAYLLIRRLEELGETLEEVSDRVAQLEAEGVEIISTEQAYSSSSQPSLTQVTQLFQEIHSNQLSRRLKQGHARNRIQALPPPGKAPYGYRRGKDRYIIDRSTAPVVKDFFERFLLFGSLRGAVRYLEQKYGKKISVSTGRRWLGNVVYRGDTAYQNGEVISDTHTPILSREEAAQIDRLLRRNRRLPSRTASANRSLAGLVVCGECQSGMKITRVTQRRKEKEYLYLRPIHCPRESKCSAIPYSEVLQGTIDRICQDLPRAVKQLQMPNTDGIKTVLQGKIEEKKEIMKQISPLKEQGILDTETADLRVYKLQTEISELRAKLEQLPPVNLGAIAQAVSIPQFWLDLSESERRFYFREFIREIQFVRISKKEWELKLIFIF